MHTFFFFFLRSSWLATAPASATAIVAHKIEHIGVRACGIPNKELSTFPQG